MPLQQFVNPTGGEVRGCDAQGCGFYGAWRDGGARLHAGVDIVSVTGQGVSASFGGTAEPITGTISGVKITGGPFVMRVLYVDAGFTGTLQVQAGTMIGTAQNITNIYPGITNHVHAELYLRGIGNIDPTPFIAFPPR